MKGWQGVVTMTKREKAFLALGLVFGLALGASIASSASVISKLILGGLGYLVVLGLALGAALLVPAVQDLLEVGLAAIERWLGEGERLRGNRPKDEDRPPVNPWGMPNPPYPPAGRGHR
jgi:hypothetical protein